MNQLKTYDIRVINKYGVQRTYTEQHASEEDAFRSGTRKWQAEDVFVKEVK